MENIITKAGMILNDIPEMLNNKIKFKKLNPNAQVPTRGSEEAAGYDLYACIDATVTINPHETIKIGTGLSIELPRYTFGAIVPRSGLSTKKGLRPANTPGTCDSDYRGEYIVAMHNDSNIPQNIEPGERIAQLIIIPYVPVIFEESEELSKTERSNSGFGSTGQF